jgi:hypothetical protein
MADAVWAVQKATPYSLVYKITGGATQGNLPAATMLTDAVPGPLETLIRKLNATNKLNYLNLDAALSSRVRVRLVTGINFAQTLPPTAINVQWWTNGMTADVPAASQLFVEIRFAQSVER